MKAIETEYSGVKFRSRLEARWAVFFDALGVKWEFEPEGFELQDGTRYLPDFWLPDSGVYVEVKPAGDPFVKARLFALESKHGIVLAEGEPGGEMQLVRRQLFEEGVAFHPNKQRIWYSPSDGEVRDFHADAAAKARGHRFWNPPGRAA